MKALYFSPVGAGAERYLDSVLDALRSDQECEVHAQLCTYGGIDLTPWFDRASVVTDPHCGLAQHAQRYLTPIRVEDYDLILFWVDDLALVPGWSWREYRKIHLRNRLEVSMPALAEGSCERDSRLHDCTRRQPGIGRLTDFIELGMGNVFTREAWLKLWPHLDRAENFYGWGYDVLMRSICGYERMGVIDAQPILHTRTSSEGNDEEKNRDKDELISRYPDAQLAQGVVLGELV